MANTETRTADAKGRVTLPHGFANATVLVEQVSETEVRIRKAVVVAEEELAFHPVPSSPLSDRDRDRFLAMLDNPPPLNPVAQNAIRMLNEHGRLAD